MLVFELLFIPSKEKPIKKSILTPACSFKSSLSLASTNKVCKTALKIAHYLISRLSPSETIWSFRKEFEQLDGYRYFMYKPLLYFYWLLINWLIKLKLLFSPVTFCRIYCPPSEDKTRNLLEHSVFVICILKWRGVSTPNNFIPWNVT